MAELMEYPRFDPTKGWGHYWLEVAKYNKILETPKKEAILKYINDWLGIKSVKEKFKSLTAFDKKYIQNLPNNEQSKKFLIKNFNYYNEFFKLDLEYDEELFTKYNVLYMLKLMLKTIEFDLKREKTDKYKRYTIICKKQLFCY